MSAPPDVTRLIWVDLLVTFLFSPNNRPTTKGRHPPPGSQEIRGPSTLLTERLVGWLNGFLSARLMLWPRREAAPGTRVALGRPRLAGRSARRGIQPGLASEGENPAAPALNFFHQQATKKFVALNALIFDNPGREIISQGKTFSIIKNIWAV